MKTRVILFAIIFLILLSHLVSSADNGHVRVIAHTESEVNEATAHGCKVVRQARTLNALTCPPPVASSLGLTEDMRFFADDTAVNTQIRANIVQSSGNTGNGRKVVILDTGYNYNHPALASSYLGGKDFVNNDNDPLDDNGHGTHVAGIITADGTNAQGVAPGTSVISGKVLDATGAGFFSDTTAAIYWAVDGPDGLPSSGDEFGADAISLSLGSSAPNLYKGFCDNVLPDLTLAIKYARDNGVLVVVAAGNSGNPGVSLPGCISHSTTVGAVDALDKIASFSGRGSAVDITAPGVKIFSTWLDGGYATASGTSMATPVVTGTVALIKTAHPTYTPSQVEDALFKTAKDLGKRSKDTSYGWGRVDAYSASQ